MHCRRGQYHACRWAAFEFAAGPHTTATGRMTIHARQGMLALTLAPNLERIPSVSKARRSNEDDEAVCRNIHGERLAPLGERITGCLPMAADAEVYMKRSKASPRPCGRCSAPRRYWEETISIERCENWQQSLREHTIGTQSVRKDRQEASMLHQAVSPRLSCWHECWMHRQSEW